MVSGELDVSILLYCTDCIMPRRLFAKTRRENLGFFYSTFNLYKYSYSSASPEQQKIHFLAACTSDLCQALANCLNAADDKSAVIDFRLSVSFLSAPSVANRAMSFGGQTPTIIVLKEGTDSSQGKGQIISNIQACLAVQDTIRSTLGPYGGDLLLVDDNGRQTITNDGATVMKVGSSPQTTLRGF